MGPDPTVVARYVDSPYRFLEMEKLRQLMRHWFGPDGLGRCRYPSTYVSVDIETSGFSLENDFVLEVGWTIMRDRRPVTSGNILLNWFEHPGVNQSWLAERIRETQRRMHEKNQQYPFDIAMFYREGVPPTQCLATLVDVIDEAAATAVLGNNIFAFDTGRLDHLRHRWHDGLAFDWNPNGIIDVGLFEKAAQQDRMPWPGTSLADWYKRAAAPPFTGAKWSMDFLINKYRLQQRYGLQTLHLHRAAYDSYAAACAFETFRDIADGLYQDSPPVG